MTDPPMAGMRTLLRHPRIRTGDPAAPVVTGVLVDDGVVVATGAAEQLDGAGVTVVDLPGASVLPGLIDAHLHTLQYADALESADLRWAASLDETLQMLRAHLTTDTRAGRDSWITGGYWDWSRWDVPAQPDCRALDNVTGDRPALLDSLDGHTLWANSAALRAAGITRETPDPVGGTIVRDGSGEPTGILRETAGDLVATVIPADSVDVTAEKLLRATRRLAALGLTSIHDIDDEDARAGFRQLHASGQLPIRVCKAVRHGALPLAVQQRRRTGEGDGWLWNGPVKLFSDGALGSRTCHMCHAFIDQPGNLGIAVTTDQELWAATHLALSNGIAVTSHAIGDRANQRVLDTYARAADAGLGPLHGGPRLTIEHVQYLRPADLDRLAALRVTASMQPTHCTTDWDLAERVLQGHDLLPYAWRGVLDSGAVLAFGSDAPIEDPNPFLGLHAAITRQRVDGTPHGGWRTEQAITAEEALSAYTTGAAYAIGREHDLGRLAPGYRADLIAVDTDPLDGEVGAIPDTGVLASWVDGQPLDLR